MSRASISKAGNTPIKKVGHTVNKNHGTNPLAKQRGSNTPSEINFKG